MPNINVLYAEVDSRNHKSLKLLSYYQLPEWLRQWEITLEHNLLALEKDLFDKVTESLYEIPAALDLEGMRSLVIQQRLQSLQKTLRGVSSPGSWIDHARPEMIIISDDYAQTTRSEQNAKELIRRVQDLREDLRGVYDKTGDTLVAMTLAHLDCLDQELKDKPEGFVETLMDFAHAAGERHEFLSKGAASRKRSAIYAEDARAWLQSWETMRWTSGC